ncbi:MAG: queuosine precursor transporter [Bacteroidia bacterium]
MFDSKKGMVYVILAGLFITNAVVAELIGSKIVQFGPFILSIGIIPWPVVFITTDIINEYYGRSGVRKLSLITAGLIAYAFIILFFAIHVPAAAYPSVSTVSDSQFSAVFGQGMLIIIGSLVAFLVSQFVDVFIFWMLRDRTGGKMMWLRSTGSTVISQLVDTFIVGAIAFWLPGKWTTKIYLEASLTGYTFKLGIAILLTPLIYLAHRWIDKYLGDQEAHTLVKHTAEESLHHKVKD